ncbi:MAG TPA: hypothetical protein VHT53_05650 [Candidatus Elarobacter sp.]|nr:hypothetical protein [Candidatus Elarobacter sp.]
MCSSLREALAPAVYDVMTVDRLIVTERSTLADMAKTSGDPQAREKLEGSGAMNMMRTRLSAAVVATARNLGAVDALLKERTADSAANADDRRALADVQTALRRVAKEQNEALNTVAGYLETELQGQMRTEYDSQLLEAVGPVGGSAKLQPPLTGSGLQMNEPIPVFDRRTLLTNDTAFGRTVYDELSRSLARHQQMIAKSESAVSPSIVKLAAKCGGTKP